MPREDFVSPGHEEFAYEDGPMPIGEGQTISQPYIVALMIQGAELKRGDRLVEQPDDAMRHSRTHSGDSQSDRS